MADHLRVPLAVTDSNDLWTLMDKLRNCGNVFQIDIYAVRSNLLCRSRASICLDVCPAWNWMADVQRHTDSEAVVGESNAIH